VPGGGERLVDLKLTARGKRAVRAAGARGLAASVQLEAKHRVQRLASVLLVPAG
jgi:hypothetical protein